MSQPCCCWFLSPFTVVNDRSISFSALFETLFLGGGQRSARSFPFLNFVIQSVTLAAARSRFHTGPLSPALSLALGALVCLAQQKQQCGVCSRLCVKRAAWISETLCLWASATMEEVYQHILLLPVYITPKQTRCQCCFSSGTLWSNLQVPELFRDNPPSDLDLQTKPSSCTTGLRDSQSTLLVCLIICVPVLILMLCAIWL